MFFCYNIAYTMSDLKAVDHHLLQFLRPLKNYSVSKVWIEEFCDFLIRRQKLFLEKNRRAKEVPISFSFHRDWPSEDLTSACLRAGSIYVHFEAVRGDLCAFDEKNSFTDTINKLITE